MKKCGGLQTSVATAPLAAAGSSGSGWSTNLTWTDAPAAGTSIRRTAEPVIRTDDFGGVAQEVPGRGARLGHVDRRLQPVDREREHVEREVQPPHVRAGLQVAGRGLAGERELERDPGLEQRQAEAPDADVEVGRDLVDGGVDGRDRAPVEDRGVRVARRVVDDHEPLDEVLDALRQHGFDRVREVEQVDERDARGKGHRAPPPDLGRRGSVPRGGSAGCRDGTRIAGCKVCTSRWDGRAPNPRRGWCVVSTPCLRDLAAGMQPGVRRAGSGG